MNASGLSSDTSVDRFIIKYKEGTSERKSASAVQSRLDSLGGALPAKARHSRRMGIGSDVVQTARKLNSADAKAFMRAVASDPDVEFIEPDAEMSATGIPNDPEYGSQWYLASNQKPGVGDAGIRAEEAWNLSSGSGAVIAVVDNGVTSHSDLNTNYLPGYDFGVQPRGGNGMNPGIIGETSCKATSWHGTHVAGIAAALTNNGIGIAGVAPAAKILPVRVMNACARGLTSNIADGITWAAGGTVPGVPANSNPANIVNLSLGGTGECSASLQSAIDFATSKGAVVVVAAGNNGVDAINWDPANCRNVITVGGSNSDGSMWGYSNFGPSVDVAAPSGRIWSTYNNGSIAPGTEGYGYMDGTSQSAPQVAGVVALAQSVAPKVLTTAELRTLIQQNVQPFAPKKPDQPIGPGILDATATVSAAKAGKIPSAADFSCSQNSTLMQVTCTDLSTARGGATIKNWAWNFGTEQDMIRTESVNPYINFDSPGVRSFRLTITDSNGNASTFSRPFSVHPPTLIPLNANEPGYTSAKSYHMTFYQVTVPAGAKNLKGTMTPSNSKDTAMIYLRAGTPSMLHPDCEAVMVSGNAGTCTIPNPASGTWYFIYSGSTSVTRAEVMVTYDL